nr:unnamed protein product [Digitaria exilis]
MGREATELDAEQQQQLLLRRCRRLFTAQERSFRIDRRSQAATALRAAVTDVLPRFLGSYTDDTLAEYIVILVCNGKHQYQARDDLEAFLGDDSEKFVAWLWSYLSKQAVEKADNFNLQHGMDNESENFNDKKNLVTKAHHGDAHVVNSKISAPETYHGLHKLDSTTGRNVPQRCIRSTVIISPERLGCNQCIWENQHHENGQNAPRSFSERITSAQSEELHEEHLGRNASTRSPAQSKTPSSVREDGNSCRNKPVKEEILDVKLKLKQMEQDVLKLRSKQAQINNGKQGPLSLGLHANLEEDADSRTVLVTNVHFAATKESLSMHFMKCGTVVKVNILTDAITGHPKGAAYVTFSDRESIEKAVSLSGTSFLTRVMRKAEAPAGFPGSVRQTGRPLQPWKSPQFQKVSTPKQTSGYHLQWKRDQSVLEKSPASCATN